MGADALPDNVGVATDALCPVLECGAPVGRPRHLEDAGRAPHALHSQPWAEDSGLRSSTNCRTASRKALCWSGLSFLKSSRNAATQSYAHDDDGNEHHGSVERACVVSRRISRESRASLRSGPPGRARGSVSTSISIACHSMWTHRAGEVRLVSAALGRYASPSTSASDITRRWTLTLRP
jgi:hypothetical protein